MSNQHPRFENEIKGTTIEKQVIAAILTLVLMLAITVCGGQSAYAQEAAGSNSSADTLKGIYEALVATDSDYCQNKAMMVEYYPELEYGETLGTDRITLAFKANGNEYFTDGTWDFVQDGDRLTAVIADSDYTGIMNVIYMAGAIGSCFGMETELVGGYLNGLGALGLESENFSMTEDNAAGTTTYFLNISGPWDMKELDQMVLTEAILDTEELNDDYVSQGGSVGKLRYLANGNVNGYTVLFAEFGELDDVAYQSMVNLISLRKPAGYEAFLADFTELKALETDDYTVDLDPDDDTIAEIMGERNEKLSYMLVRFGSEEYGEEDYVIY